MTDSSPQPKYTLWQAVSAAVSLSLRAIEEVRALARIPGPPGEKGADGAPGKLPLVKEYKRGVSYEGDVVTSGGSLWQALRDTAEPPGHADWQPLALKGIDATEPEHRGLYDPNTEYRRHNIVALDGGSFWAKRDNPGPCPGEGWYLLVSRGKPGKPGEQGPRGSVGERGERGLRGVGLRDIRIEGFALIAEMDDGEVIARDLRPAFEAYHAEVSRGR